MKIRLGKSTGGIFPVWGGSIVWTPPPPFFKGVGVNFNYFPWRRGSEKLKRGESMVQGKVFFKRGAGTFPN